jgi:hypothetical protein
MSTSLKLFFFLILEFAFKILKCHQQFSKNFKWSPKYHSYFGSPIILDHSKLGGVLILKNYDYFQAIIVRLFNEVLRIPQTF